MKRSFGVVPGVSGERMLTLYLQIAASAIIPTSIPKHWNCLIANYRGGTYRYAPTAASWPVSLDP